MRLARCLEHERPVTTTDYGDFERRVRENQRVVYQIAYSVLGNAADAEEVAQDAFVRAHSKLSGLREPAKFRAWVSQICRRLALNRLRSDSRARQRETLASAPETAADSAVIVEERAFAERVRLEIGRLPEKLRGVMLLCAIEGLDHAAVAGIMGIPEGTVRSRLHLARKRLLKALDI